MGILPSSMLLCRILFFKAFFCGIVLSGISSLVFSSAVSASAPDSGMGRARIQTQTLLSSHDHSMATGRFATLVDAAEYYATLNQRGWAAIGAGPALVLGQRHPQIAELRYMLTLYGDYQRPATGRVQLNKFDQALADALRSFQRRHGLNPDAVMGPDTRQALNVLPQDRSYQLLLNHERQRPLQDRMPRDYIQVNLPEFQLRLYRDTESVLEMKTIIGQQSRSTPTLKSEIKSLVVNPGWNIPRSIAYKDILPKWQESADYLEKQNMRIVSGWGADKIWVDTAEAGPASLYRGRAYPRLYQLPGRNNALGKIKFDSPNTSAIYLHDSPAKYLFKRRTRAFSSGCVRVENPRLLAKYLLGTQAMDLPLDALLAGSDTHRIRLLKPMGLYLTYWTAWLDPRQGLQFRNDIYQRDLPAQEVTEIGLLALDRQGVPHGS